MYKINVEKQTENAKVTEARVHVDRLVGYLKKLSDEEKVKTGKITFRENSLVFIADITAAIEKFEAACVDTEEKQFTQEEVNNTLKELEVLNKNISELESDNEISDLGSVRMYQARKIRQAELTAIKAEFDKESITFKELSKVKSNEN